MPIFERVTVTLPGSLLKEIDRQEKNRSKFVTEAVRQEIDRRQRAELKRSLENPHPEASEISEQGLDEWARTLPQEDTSGLLDSEAGRPVRWVTGQGWLEDQI